MALKHKTIVAAQAAKVQVKAKNPAASRTVPSVHKRTAPPPGSLDPLRACLLYRTQPLSATEVLAVKVVAKKAAVTKAAKAVAKAQKKMAKADKKVAIAKVGPSGHCSPLAFAHPSVGTRPYELRS